MAVIEILKTDITQLAVDAVVNAANNSLMGGGGVDGAIHRAAGSTLLAECVKLGGCQTGQAVITGAGIMKAKYIIHTVGPVWRGGQNHETELLASCYENTLLLARKNNVKTIAFPNISTGVYGFPKDKAAAIAIKTVKEHLLLYDSLEKLIFACFDEANFAIYAKLLYRTA